MQQTKQIVLSFQYCRFINYDELTEENYVRFVDRFIIAKALSLIIYDQIVNKITINILNTSFLNCTSFKDPLIRVFFSYYGSTHIYFKETKLLNNSGIDAVQIQQIFQGERISFVNGTQYFGHCTLKNAVCMAIGCLC